MQNEYQQTVNAMQFDGSLENIKQILNNFDWRGHNIAMDFDDIEKPKLTIDNSTFSRGQQAEVSNYLVQEPTGDFVVYKESKFKALFKPKEA